MKNRLGALAGLLVVTLLLGGCGTPLYELTEEEENLIVQYAAYALAKHNIYQKDGMSDAQLPEEETQEEQSNTEETKTQQQTTGEGGSSSGNTNLSYEEISLEKAIDQEELLSVSYEGCKILDSYKEGTYFVLNPDSGNKMLVMNFTIKNTGQQKMELSTLSLDNTFYASIGGRPPVKETVSFGVQSLSSFEGTIAAGKTAKAVLIFQIPEDFAEEQPDIELMVSLKGTNYSVKY